MQEKIKLNFLDQYINSDELRLIPMRDLKKLTICPGHLFYSMKGGRKINLILRAGHIITTDFILKYESGGVYGLHIWPVQDKINTMLAKKIFKDLKNETDEKKKNLLRIKFINWFSKIYWEEELRGSLLDLVCACDETFFRLSPELHENIYESSHEFFNRSHLLASLAVGLSICIGYSDFKILSDIYHACFLLDYDLMDSNLDYRISKALEFERKESGRGFKYLIEQNSPQKVIDKFRQHPIESRKKIYEFADKIFHYPEIISLIDIHHEDINGMGFPNELFSGELNDLESLVITLDRLLEFKDVRYFREDGFGYLKKLFNFDNGEVVSDSIPHKRIGKLLFSSFSNLKPKLEKIEASGNSACVA